MGGGMPGGANALTPAFQIQSEYIEKSENLRYLQSKSILICMNDRNIL